MEASIEQVLQFLGEAQVKLRLLELEIERLKAELEQRQSEDRHG